MKIFKYRVQISTHPFAVELPQGAKILSVDTQQNQCYIWALVDPEARPETRHFRIIATGEEFDPAGLTYIGSWHHVEGWMVFHLFESGVQA